MTSPAPIRDWDLSQNSHDCSALVSFLRSQYADLGSFLSRAIPGRMFSLIVEWADRQRPGNVGCLPAMFLKEDKQVIQDIWESKKASVRVIRAATQSGPLVVIDFEFFPRPVLDSLRAYVSDLQENALVAERLTKSGAVTPPPGRTSAFEIYLREPLGGYVYRLGMNMNNPSENWQAKALIGQNRWLVVLVSDNVSDACWIPIPVAPAIHEALKTASEWAESCGQTNPLARALDYSEAMTEAYLQSPLGSITFNTKLVWQSPDELEKHVREGLSKLGCDS